MSDQTGATSEQPRRGRGSSEAFGAKPLVDPGPDAPEPPKAKPDSIGHYKLLELLGEGGFGVVWLAEQTEPVRRRVAVKVIKPGMDSKAVIARFEAERQALAMMSHPNVAKVFDAGTTPLNEPGGGRPYFVMEHVKGAPITEYCDTHKLTIDQRLRLFAVVCEAVQHAHMKGIIHRDLKPSNILVTVVESGEPRPVVIDFGVAKALAGRLTEQTIYTERGVLIGTPEYMSPEQAEMAETDIDTRSDVYSLGVVLYQLLSGSAPFVSEALRTAGLSGLQKMIRESEPPRPSDLVASMDDAGKATGAAGGKGARIAAARGLRHEELITILRRELEWIPLKAIRKDRSDRYRSASEMADDVKNYLENRPLIAGPEKTAYKVRKFVRRNKVTVGAAGLIAASLVVATAVSLWFGVRAAAATRRETDQRVAAEAAVVRAEKINSFMTRAFRAGDASTGGRQDATIIHAMQNGIAEIEAGAFADDPETEASLRETIGTILMTNGKLQDAEAQLTVLLSIRRRLFPGDHPGVASALNNLAAVRKDFGRTVESEALASEALAMRRRMFTGDHPDVASSLNTLAVLRDAVGRSEEAEPLFEEALAMRRRLFTGDHDEVARSLIALGHINSALGRDARAEALQSEGLAMQRRLYRGDHPAIALSLANLANIVESRGRINEAEPMHVEALEMRRRLFKGDHPSIANSINNLAHARTAMNRLEDAESLFEESLGMYRRILNAEHPMIGMALSNLAQARIKLSKFAEAEPLLTEAVGIVTRARRGDHPDIVTCTLNLAHLHLRTEAKWDEAREGFEAGVAMQRRLSPNGSPSLASVLWKRGKARRTMGDATGARSDLLEAVAVAEKVLLEDHPDLAKYRAELDK